MNIIYISFFVALENALKKIPFLETEVTIHDKYDGDLDRLQAKFKTTYNEDVKNFYKNVSFKITISWKLKEGIENIISKEDYGYVGGNISIVGPSEMIMGPRSEFWKDIYWFDSDSAENALRKEFVPFDTAANGTNSVGFLKQGDEENGYKLSKELYLYNYDYNVVPLPFTFENYLEFIIKSKGFWYFIEYYNKPDSDVYKRFMHVMPKLFADFDEQYFTKFITNK